jgi:hypothetical protein
MEEGRKEDEGNKVTEGRCKKVEEGSKAVIGLV